MSGVGRLWLRFAVAGAFVLAVAGDPFLAAVIAGILTLVLKIESRL